VPTRVSSPAVEDVHEPQPSVEGTFDNLYGLEITSLEDGRVTGLVPVLDRVKQPFGIVHGGVHCAIAESLASVGTWNAVKDQGMIAMGVSNQTSFLRPASEGELRAEAVAIHRGRTTWVWDVSVRDSADRLCAVSRMTIAVRSPA